jgi:hypothetical protein
MNRCFASPEIQVLAGVATGDGATQGHNIQQAQWLVPSGGRLHNYCLLAHESIAW